MNCTGRDKTFCITPDYVLFEFKVFLARSAVGNMNLNSREYQLSYEIIFLAITLRGVRGTEKVELSIKLAFNHVNTYK